VSVEVSSATSGPSSFSGPSKAAWQDVAAEGSLGEALPHDVELSPDQLRSLYRLMALSRRVDRQAINLTRQGALGVFASSHGQEAAQVGSVFALEAGLAALRWLAAGYGYEITGVDVWAAYSHTIKAAERIGRRDEVRERIRTFVAGRRFLVEVLGRELGLIGKGMT